MGVILWYHSLVLFSLLVSIDSQHWSASVNTNIIQFSMCWEKMSPVLRASAKMCNEFKMACMKVINPQYKIWKLSIHLVSFPPRYQLDQSFPSLVNSPFRHSSFHWSRRTKSDSAKENVSRAHKGGVPEHHYFCEEQLFNKTSDFLAPWRLQDLLSGTELVPGEAHPPIFLVFYSCDF